MPSRQILEIEIRITENHGKSKKFANKSVKMSETVCRLCRQESDHLESLLGIREGLPLSVLIMIICPIKIERKDSLPKFVCGECLEIVLSAYKLRDESIESDRYFRETNEKVSVHEVEDKPVRVKEPQAFLIHVDTDPLSVFTIQTRIDTALDGEDGVSTKKSRSSSLAPRNVQTDFRTNEVFPYKVECFKSGRHKSYAWDYFGRLIDKEGQVVESEAEFFFCKLCVSEKRSIRKRYRSEKISTGMIFQHLKSAHGIEKETTAKALAPRTSGSDEDEKQLKKPKLAASESTTPSIQGLTFSCPQNDCDKVYNMKICLDIHLGLEHTGIAEEYPAETDFHVDTSGKDHSKSMAWNYFGPLLDANFELIDDDHNYCRLCVGNGNFSKYAKSCSTATLLHHLRDHHTQSKRKKETIRKL